MNKVITIHEAKTNLSKYIKQARTGEPVYIGGYGIQEVVLVAAKPKNSVIKFGTAQSKIQYINSTLEGADPDIRQMFYEESQALN